MSNVPDLGNLPRTTAPRHGLEDWERQIIDSAKLFRSGAHQMISRAFEDLWRALWVLDAPPEQVTTALDRLHVELVAAADQARAKALREWQRDSPERVG